MYFTTSSSLYSFKSLPRTRSSYAAPISPLYSWFTIRLPKTKFSQVRLNYLLKTIKYFKNYGRVYLVRLPIHSSLMKIENDLIPKFNDIINEAIISSDEYIDLTTLNSSFQYIDGNHLNKASGEVVSKEIAEWIKNNKPRTHNTQ